MAKPYLVPAIKRAFEVIDLLAESHRGMTISDIHRTLRLPLSSCANILYTLQALGSLDRDPETSEFTLGVRMLSVYQRVPGQMDLVRRCHGLLEQLVQECSLAAHLAVMRDGEAMYVDRVAGPGFVQFSSYVGMRWPLYASGVGKALLAFLPEEERKQTLKQLSLRKITSRTISSRTRIEKQLREFQRIGYCWEDGEGELGVACVAAPLLGQGQKVVAAVSITGTSHQITEKNLPTLGNVVRRYARLMSARLNGEA